jgi:phosphohistidine phosphatase SixA
MLPFRSLATHVRAAALLTLALGAPLVPASAQSPRATNGTAAPAQSNGPALVLVVRHAEKADNSDDPVLSAAGEARALALAEALSDARVDHVIVTHRQRTRLTAAPLLAARGLTPEVVPFGRDMAEHVAAVAAAVRRRPGQVVLVVGHSNTVPMIVHALGGPKQPDLCDARYGGLFVVTPGDVGQGRLVVADYGAADPPTARTCAGMVPR